MLSVLLVVLLGGAASVRDVPQSRDTLTERVAGIVQDSSGKPVPAATVVITRGPDRFVVRTVADSSGRFGVVFQPGTGDYLVYASAGLAGTVRRRVRRGDEGIGVPVVLVLRPSVTTLGRVVVAATRPRPPRAGSSLEPDPGAATSSVEGLGGWLGTVRPGSVSEQFATTPGVLASDGSLAIAGLASQGHQSTLNGSEVGVGALPALARTRLRLATSTVDPAQGGFSGAQVAIELSPGSNIAHRELSLQALPPVPFGDNAVSAYMIRGPRDELSVNGAADGALAYDRLYFSTAAQLTIGQRSTSLDSSEPAWKETLGRLDAVLGDLPAPLRVGRADDRSFALSGAARIDRTPRGDHALQLSALGRIARSSDFGNALSTAGRTLAMDESSAALQSSYATYFGGMLNELRGALSLSRSAQAPRSLMPEGRVGLDADVDAGTAGSLLIGGTGSGRALQERASAELVNETSAYLHGTAHRIKASAGVRFNGERREALANTFGTFTYGDLADLDANRPSSYTRSLTPRTGGVSTTSAFLAMSDNWRLGPTARVLYGLRVDLRESPGDPAVASAGRSAAGGQPLMRADVSPRIGFTWTYRSPSRAEPPVRSGALGTFSSRSHGTVRGSFGRYVGAPSTDALIQAETFSRARQARMRCLGAAAPAPDWVALLRGSPAEPYSCLGSGGLIDSSGAEYHVAGHPAGADSWRATLGWGSAGAGLALNVDGTVSLSRRIMALGLTAPPRTPQFTSWPDDRPVYVRRDDIDPASGLLVPAGTSAARSLSYTYAELGAGRGAQLTVAVSPLVAKVSSRHWSIAYTLARSTVAAHGLEYPGAAGSPAGETVPASFDVRHTIVGQIGTVTASGYTVVMMSRAQSGTPFTPIVAGDVDGDGVTGDRAYIPTRASAGDGSLGAAVSSVIASTTNAGRACIRQAEGTIAGINRCRAPWSFNSTLVLRTPPGVNPRLPFGERVTATLYADNVVSFMDRLVNGRRLEGWGGSSDLDPVLLRVAGFEPATGSFTYRPNPAFGRARGTSPSSQYRVGISISVDLSQPATAQALQRFLSPGRGLNPGPRLSADTIAARFGRTVSDVYQLALEQGDSLLLTREQFDSLSRWHEEYRSSVASIWSALGRRLAVLESDYDAREVLALTESVTDDAWGVAQDHARRIYRSLDPLQQTLVPALLRTLATSDRRVRVRVTTAW